MELSQIVTCLKNAFEQESIKQQVLEPNWLELNRRSNINSTGFCFSASEVIYRLNGGKDNWFIKSINDPKDWNNGTHYFLQNKETDKILDVTSNQYTLRNIEIPYHLGKARGLQRISMRASLLARLTGLDELK